MKVTIEDEQPKITPENTDAFRLASNDGLFLGSVPFSSQQLRSFVR